VDDSSSDELRQEAKLVASAGLISKRTMAIAFGLAILAVALTSIKSLGVWWAGIMSLLGLFLAIWGAVLVVRNRLIKP
jgi:hypothetical protein